MRSNSTSIQHGSVWPSDGQAVAPCWHGPVARTAGRPTRGSIFVHELIVIIGIADDGRGAGQGTPKAKGKGKARAKAKGAPALVTRTRGPDGKMRVAGIKKALRNSQVYPVKFALAVVKHHWPERTRG